MVNLSNFNRLTFSNSGSFVLTDKNNSANYIHFGKLGNSYIVSLHVKLQKVVSVRVGEKVGFHNLLGNLQHFLAIQQAMA